MKVKSTAQLKRQIGSSRDLNRLVRALVAGRDTVKLGDATYQINREEVSIPAAESLSAY